MWLSGSWRSFLYSSLVYSCHLFLISSSSVRSIPFLSFIENIFAWNVPLVSLIFLKRSLVFPILLFSSISLHWSLMKGFLFLLAFFWNSAFKWVSSFLRRSAFFTVQLSHPYMATGKIIALTRWTFVDKLMSLLFNMLPRLVITFLPRSKRLLISWLQSPSAVILEPKKICLTLFSVFAHLFPM